MRVLVTGGAGYIGSVCADYLQRYGYDVVVYDDLSTGHLQAVAAPLVRGDIRDRAKLRTALTGCDAVLHFAALSLVGESVHDPLRYWSVNVGGSISLLQAMEDEGVRSLVFSSTCAVYGQPRYLPLNEDHPRAPVNPYGDTKNTVENLIANRRAAGAIRATCLRYFNAAGASDDGRLGEAHSCETHLIPLAIEAALGQRPPLTVFGDDWDTRDGSCERDYIHVMDLAEAHLLALQRLVGGHRGSAYNLGTGKGSTVFEVIDTVQQELGRPVPFSVGDRRSGDPPSLWAASGLASAELGWTPERTDLAQIVSSAARWARYRPF